MRAFRSVLIPSLIASMALFSACSPDADQSVPAEAEIAPTNDIKALAGVQTPFITGNLGTITVPALAGDGVTTLRGRDADSAADPARSFLYGFALDQLNASGDEDFEAISVRRDEHGEIGIRFNQFINGLPVKGAQLFVQADAKTGMVTRVNGSFAPGAGLSNVPALNAGDALGRALEQSSIKAETIGDSELTYVLTPDGATLAWATTVDYTDENGPQRDIVFADAKTGEVAARHPQYHYAKVLRTYNCGTGTSCTSLASSSSSTINTGDLAIDAAHNYAIATYDYYFNNFGRDSINNAGMTLKSRVHYNVAYNNAFWDGTQMTYGDGDGTTFIPLSRDADVVAHELTHGVTENESGLIYSYESGALNEAWSDIFGAAVDRQQGANITDTWLLGEDIYTPGTPGDALRTMADPVASGDYDYYPTRYTGSSDNGGVHSNSGIANLAFVLLVQGGTHPRGKTSNTVPALNGNFDTSLGMAAKIFYEANANCMTSSTNFEGARNCTAAKALAVYGATAEAAVHEAWDAVGVPGGAAPPPPTGGTLTKGVPVTGLSGAASSEVFYSIAVPAGSSNLTFTMSGGTGDADLYVKFGSSPTTASYDCRPYLGGNAESCTFATPSAGTYYVMVRAYSAYSGVSLVANYTTGGGGGCTPYSDSASGLSGATGSETTFTQDVPSCATSLTISIAGGTGDADLYVKFGSAPTTTSYNCRPYKSGNNETCTFTPPSTGTYHMMLRGYSAYSGVTLTASYQ